MPIRKLNRAWNKSPIELIFGIFLPLCDPKNPFNQHRKWVAQAIYPVETYKYFTHWEINSSLTMRGGKRSQPGRPHSRRYSIWMWVVCANDTDFVVYTIKMENDLIDKTVYAPCQTEQQCFACLIVLFNWWNATSEFCGFFTQWQLIRLKWIYGCVSASVSVSVWVLCIVRHRQSAFISILNDIISHWNCYENDMLCLLLLYIEMDNRHQQSCANLAIKRANEWTNESKYHIYYSNVLVLWWHTHSATNDETMKHNISIGICDVISVSEQQQPIR